MSVGVFISVFGELVWGAVVVSVVDCPNTQVNRVVVSVMGNCVLGTFFSVVNIISASVVEEANCVSGFDVVFGLHAVPRNVFKSHKKYVFFNFFRCRKG